jgi:hypothetical protein
MTATLGELFGIAGRQLGEGRAAAGSRGDGDVMVAVRHLSSLLGGLKAVHERTVVDRDPLFRTVHKGVVHARSVLNDTFWRMSRNGVAVTAEAWGGPLADAARSVRVVTDLIEGHQDERGAFVSLYGPELQTAPARAYIALRSAELSQTAGQVVETLLQHAPDDGVRFGLQEARGALDAVTSQIGRLRSNGDIGALPQLIAVNLEPPRPTDSLDQLTGLLRDDSERLARAAFGILTKRRLSSLDSFGGGAIQRLSVARTHGAIVLTRLLGQAGLAVKGDKEMAERFGHAAAAVQQTAQAWNRMRVAWKVVTDPADPVGGTVPQAQNVGLDEPTLVMPTVERHPAVDIARAGVTRLSQLLYGQGWNPKDPKPVPRRGDLVLTDAGGPAELMQTVYRIAAADRKLAFAVGHTLGKVHHRLLSRAQDHDLVGAFYSELSRGERHQLESAVAQVVRTSETTVRDIVLVGRNIGMDLARAHLDEAAHTRLTKTFGSALPGEPEVPAPLPSPQPRLPSASRVPEAALPRAASRGLRR